MKLKLSYICCYIKGVRQANRQTDTSYQNYPASFTKNFTSNLMSAKKSQRITVNGRNLQFLQNLAEQMDETDLTATLSYLLTDVRCLGYQIGQKPQPQPLQAPLGYSFDTSTFEKVAPIPDVDRNYQETDPIISRLANLLEEF